jgi:hypothetical protein
MSPTINTVGQLVEIMLRDRVSIGGSGDQTYLTVKQLMTTL